MQIEKRNGALVDFDASKIQKAIEKAMEETEQGVDSKVSEEIAYAISESFGNNEIPTVSDIQDIVEEYLMGSDRKDVAKRYILYRSERDRVRSGESSYSQYRFLSDDFLSRYKHKKDPFPTELGKFVYYRTYSRPIPAEGRRERWWETVARVTNFSCELELEAMQKQGIAISPHTEKRLEESAQEIYDMIYNLKLFPSGRSLWTGGTDTSKRYKLSNFNCSLLTLDSLEKFAEMFFVLMLGTGVGISVERDYIARLPRINSNIRIIHKDFDAVPKDKRLEHSELKFDGNMVEIVVGDSKEGWTEALKMYLQIISSKQHTDIDIIVFNYNHVRPAGERLKTFGGYASGHTNLKNMFRTIDSLFKSDKGSQWKTIKPIDCLDIATSIAENVVSGGVRRSALIVFCDKDETELLNAKADLFQKDEEGNWVANESLRHRALSNNTILYKERPTKEELKRQFELIRTAGEPSFGNLQEMRRRRQDVKGANPCFEILLRDRGVCNLTEVNMMAFITEDGYDRAGMLRAQELSAIIGYRMASVELELHEWDLVNSEDRLLGCSLTGVVDFLNASNITTEESIDLFKELAATARASAKAMAAKLKMNEPLLVTCVKPSGTISQLPTVSSGMHFSHSPYYVRRVRVNANDPLAQAMAEAGFKWLPENGQTVEHHTEKVFSFPVQSPQGKTKYDISAIEQLEFYKMIMKHYVDHNASNTVHVRDEEWPEVEEWIYNNWNDVVGVTFLSLDNSFYQQLPYEAITEEEYYQMLEETPVFNPVILNKYEDFKEYDILDSSCASGACPIR